MRMEETVLLYLVTGIAVGAALAWRDPRRAALWLTLGVIFWPVFLPLLFAKPRRPRPRQIHELDSLREEAARLQLDGLSRAIATAERIRAGADDLRRLFETHEAAMSAHEPAFAKEARVVDLERIRAARDEQEARYLRIVSRVREAITQAHLARFSEESRRELAKQMARLADETDILEPRA
jgi:hypothetical protein